MADTNAPQGPVAPVEATTAPAAAVTDAAEAKNGTADPKLEAFARKERQLRQMQKQIATEKQALEVQRKQYETDYVPRSRIKEDVWGVLSEAGYDYNALTEQLLQTPNDPVTKAMLAEIKSIKNQLTQSEQKAAQQTQQQYDQAVKQIDTEVKLMVDSNAEFELIKQTSSQDAVTEYIKLTFEEEGRLLSVDEACKAVENHLTEENYKISQTTKMQAKLKPATEVTQPQSQATAQQTSNQSGIKTLSNKMQVTTPKRTTEKERRERAILAFQGKLNT